MSEPKRYDFGCQFECDDKESFHQAEYGKYVLWDDYSSLRAENAALRVKMAGMVCGTCRGVEFVWCSAVDHHIPCPVCQPKEGA